ncbi:MAG: hypothetical protein A3G00_01400 [Candidatus Magasanikbacteria bacterium RIFCSPLOWO2_12_FULL_43_12]|uniref:Chromosome partition protein Smc n=1 Tax=Candidatus Magasanikbacteria bacterium RIFCSPLOWO2_12_FULL_43_12 TaxID=1798692 RepID=A0A1F6MTI7_9BACT|nr:MAG: hypothetical protein A3C74_00815 [Candidatus Magasanikbacteria bacterium RIFCSPHIGHO2_02_FULL_44_13]OGH72717.1 MAG: hypothetical protein A3I93_03970 [Candidatus Magasanikbacteria bacterium RIFCSPLOWO2_02_FULL_43_22]OGH74989.1 MAG: hypothetical protein A3G00_01400 [Candidatus Magasanikbacteria bacterium RIFCSPLOWO2_12_FULL_43_12]
MFLKSIELHGFKSFAQKAVLDFVAPKDGKNSITAVVGPNGSGKSNIADAIRWVMGEQSMKTLRGKKGEDVIFGGSDAKGQMGIASVTMILDNSDHRAPIDYDELVVTRRYYRSGESEYLVNGNTVRLLDLQILLAQAQFGQGAYSVIGQGMIDHLLLHTPQERKAFFDEAAGIKEFQIKRHQAILKLSRTKENITQAEMLLTEIEPRLRTLSRQVKRLERRQEVELELRETQEQYYFTLFSHNHEQLSVLNTELIKIEQEYNEAHSHLQTLQNELAALAKEGSRQEQFVVLQNEYQDLSRQKNQLERERAILQGKLQTEYSKAGKQNIGWLENKIENLKTAAERSARELKEAESAVEKTGAEILTKKQLMDKLLVEKTEAKGQLANYEQSLTQLKGEQSYWQYAGLKAVQAVLEERHRLGAIYGTVAQLGEVDEKYRLALDVAAASHLSSVVVDSDRTAQAGIEYLRQHQLGVATFLPLNKIKPRLKANDIQDLKNRDGVFGLASELVSFDSRFADIFSYALGNTLIVRDLEVAREIGIGRIRMVTLAGDVLETSGSMKGGYRQAEKHRGLGFSQGSSPYLLQNNILDSEEKMTGLQNRLTQNETDLNQAQVELTTCQSRAQIAVSRADILGAAKQETDRELAMLEQELSLCAMSPEEFNASLKTIASQKEESDQSIVGLDKKLESVQKKIATFNNEEEKKKQRIFSLQDAMQAEQEAVSKIIENRNLKKIEAAKLDTKLEDLTNEIYQEIQTTPDSLRERGIQILLPQDLEEAQVKIQKLKYQLSLIGGIDEEAAVEYKETKEKYEHLTAQLDDLGKAFADLEQMVVELDELMKKKRGKAFKEIQKEFARYFAMLFEGGKAELVELYGEEIEAESEIDIADAQIGAEQVDRIGLKSVTAEPAKKKKQILMGIDIVACPPGKKIKSVQALSGGERTMTSIALVCAILNTNPSPFVVLDEVEAALDETNTMRLNRILHELSYKSQFVLITHNRVTMHAADALYGVTMGESGVSQLVSVKLNEAVKAL